MAQSSDSSNHTFTPAEKKAHNFYWASAFFAVLGTIFLFVYWPVGIFLIVVMICCVTGAILQPTTLPEEDRQRNA
ncbi:hypothetical protein [Compostibacter hankyongensis]|uniref:Uncharacterized protein n=1 Tax=Compostibacter hankyongensis TaxID=1007089 RepID=A0ABP8FIN2_9BACT